MKHLKLYEEQTSNETISVKKDVVVHLLQFYGYEMGSLNMLSSVEYQVNLMKKWNVTFQDYKKYYPNHYEEVNYPDAEYALHADCYDKVVYKAAIHKEIKATKLDLLDIFESYLYIEDYIEIPDDSSTDSIETLLNPHLEEEGYISSLEEVRLALIPMALQEGYTINSLVDHFKKVDSSYIERMEKLGLINQDDVYRIKNSEYNKDIMDL